jgi:hypothetical protein
MNLYETIEKFNHILGYNPSNPSGFSGSKTYGYTNDLVEAKKLTDRNMSFHILKELREGRGDAYKNMLHFIPNVRDILQLDEGVYRTYSQFLSQLQTDPASMQSPDNAVRKVYNRFIEGKPQSWNLIDPVEYKACLTATIKDILHQKAEEMWNRKVDQWEDNIKFNILQFIANSILTSGKELGVKRPHGERLKDLWNIWYLVSGDQQIPHYDKDGKTMIGETPANKEYFDTHYWRPFVDYIETSFSDDAGMSYETDSSINPLLDIVALFDKNPFDLSQKIVALNRVIDIVHGRGSLSYLFIRGGKPALDKIGASPEDLKKYEAGMSEDDMDLHNERVGLINKRYNSGDTYMRNGKQSQWTERNNNLNKN